MGASSTRSFTNQMENGHARMAPFGARAYHGRRQARCTFRDLLLFNKKQILKWSSAGYSVAEIVLFIARALGLA